MQTSKAMLKTRGALRIMTARRTSVIIAVAVWAFCTCVFLFKTHLRSCPQQNSGVYRVITNSRTHVARTSFLRDGTFKSCCLTDTGGVPLDLTLKERVFIKKNGFFIESGAQDGEFQSNTWIAEKQLNWTGLLIEPALSKQIQCVINRSNSRCVRAGLVAPDGPRELADPGGDPMAGAVEGNSLPAYPLSQLLDTLDIKHAIHLWSLDIENGELNALRGVDWNRHRPQYILVEVWNRNRDVFSLMDSAGYELEPGLHGRDDVSGWSHETSHRDFLWRDKEHKLVLLAFDHDDSWNPVKAKAVNGVAGKLFINHVAETMPHAEWIKLAQTHDFVICPDGPTTDQLQEVLMLGSFPIVETSELDHLFKELPILIVDDWSSLSIDFLRDWQAKQVRMASQESSQDLLKRS